MNESDGRKIDRKALEAIRIRAVQRVEAGESPEVVIKALGFTRARIYEWLARYREGGIDGLRSKKAPGRIAKLSGKQLEKIYRTVVGKDPRQLKFEFALWTRGMVREYIRGEFDIRLSEVSVGRLLRKIGLSPQRPKRSAYQQDSALVAGWMTKDFPQIKVMARMENAVLFFGDESSVRSDYHSGTTWAPKGQTPTVRVNGSRFRVNLISAVSGRGDLRFMATEDRVTADVFCEFLKRLLAGAQQPVYLIVDNHPVHRSKKVSEYVQSTKGALKLFFLPPYSPELNPDEQVWNYLKNHNIARQSAKDKKDFVKRIRRVLFSLQSLPQKVKSFFRHPLIRPVVMFANLCTD